VVAMNTMKTRWRRAFGRWFMKQIVAVILGGM